MSFTDLHEGILELFAEAQERTEGSVLRGLANGLRLDTWTALSLSERAAYRAWRAPRAPHGDYAVERTWSPGYDRQTVYIDTAPMVNEVRRCESCGGDVEIRPGNERLIHMGRTRACPKPRIVRAA